MARTLKIVGLAFAVVTGLLVLAVVGINLIPGDTYKALVASGAKSATGRDLVIEGDVDVHLFTTLGFKASGVRFANAGWGSRPQMASVDRIEGEVALLPLLRGVLDASLVLDNPDLLLETDTSGRANWEFKKSAGAPDTAQRTGKAEDPGKGAERGGGLFLRPLIRKLLLNGAHIAYLDGKNGTRTDVTGEILQIVTTGDGLAIELNGTCNDIPFAFTGGFDNAGHFVDNRPANARFEGSFGDAKLAVQGTAGPFAPTFDLDLSANVNAGSVAAFSVLAGRDLPDIGPLSATVKLTGKAGKYAVSDMRVALDDETLTAEAKGSVADLAGLNGLKLEAKVDTGQLAEILQAFGFQSKFPLPDAFHAAVAAEGSLKDLAVKRFEARIEGRGLTVHAGAVVKNVIAMEGVKADISMETESLDLVAAFAKTELPSFGPIKLTAAIVSKGERLGRMEVRAELNGSTIHAEVAGSVGDPLRWKDVDADLNLGVDDLTFLSESVNMKLPPLGRLRASATITSKGDTFAAKDIRADLAGGNIQAKVAGSVGDLRNLKAIHADVELAMESLSALSDVAKTALPPLGPLRASANITSNGDTFTAKDIRADLAGEAIQARVAGSVEDVLNLMGINADIHFSVDSLASLGSLVKQELPSSGPVSLDGKFSSTGGLEAPVNITAVVKSDGVSVNLTGRIAEPLAAKGVDLAVVLEAGSLQKLGWLAGTQLPDKNPVELEGRFTTGENNYELAGLHLRIGEFDVTGQAAYEPPSDAGGRPRVSGEFHAADMDLNKILAAADTSSETATPTKSKGSEAKTKAKKDGVNHRKERIFPSEPLPFGLLKSVDAEIEMTVESLTTIEFLLTNLEAGLVLENGLLSIRPLKAKVGNGTYEGAVTLDAGKSPAVLTIDDEMTGATLRKYGGAFYSLIDVKGSGDSIAAIMASLEGQFKFEVRGATLDKSLMTGFGSGLIDTLNPFQESGGKTELTCAVALFDIKDGIADAKRKIAAQLTKVTWFGGGQIDLKTEKIDFALHPEPRRGLGLDMGGLAQMVGIGGTLAHPGIVMDAKKIAKKQMMWSAHTLTGGITLLVEELWDRTRANSDICAKILEGVNKK